MLGSAVFDIYNKYRKKYSNTVEIPFDELDIFDIRCVEWYCYEIENTLNAIAVPNYNNRIIIVYKREDNSMLSLQLTFEIPYANREEYFDFIFEINNLVSENGQCTLFVNNIPYELKSYLYVQDTLEASENFNMLANKYGISVCSEIGADELYADLGGRFYNCLNIPSGCKKEEVISIISNLYFFRGRKELETLGYQSSCSKRKKVFISYCHKNKDIVYDITSMLNDCGVDMWIDIKSIDVGENILTSIMNGVKECDFSILFLSNATLESNFAKLELENIMCSTVKKLIKWYIIKLDDVDVESIFPNLSNFKYKDFYTNPNKQALVEDIINHLSK